MDPDQKLEKQINEFQAVAKENPNVDVSMLMMNALQNQKENLVSGKAKKWAYLISIGAPPFGLFFAFKYFLGDEDDAKEVAWTCVVLTVVAVVLFFFSIKLFFSGSGANLQQIEQIKPSDIKSLYQ